MVIEEGYIRMERNHQFVNKYNPVIASATGYNYNVNFTVLSPKVLAAIYSMTNYITKAQVDRDQLVLAAAVLKKAQEAAEAAASDDGRLLAPEPLDMPKFALKAYNRFARDIEVSIGSLKSLRLYGSFTSMSEKDTDILDTTLKTQDEIHEVLLGLFYPWNGLQALRSGHLESLCIALKERGIEFDDYLEVVDHNVYMEDEEVNVDMDFAMLRPTESNLLQAALAFLGIATDGLSSLPFSCNPRLLGAHFTPAALVKTWFRELKDKEWSDPDDADADANVSNPDLRSAY
ncbi:hypothetical protein V491_01016 [Pseudogymnoascus sp. VKM F-3775]|nr:hypothetical protein V491_01016 [Pseudogymnoascus sp. VKM F-3775]